jgi:hypothetical protein
MPENEPENCLKISGSLATDAAAHQIKKNTDFGEPSEPNVQHQRTSGELEVRRGGTRWDGITSAESVSLFIRRGDRIGQCAGAPLRGEN